MQVNVDEDTAQEDDQLTENEEAVQVGVTLVRMHVLYYLTVKGKRCGVCQLEMKGRVGKLACGDQFHLMCASEWLELGEIATCPLCRRLVDNMELLNIGNGSKEEEFGGEYFEEDFKEETFEDA